MEDKDSIGVHRDRLKLASMVIAAVSEATVDWKNGADAEECMEKVSLAILLLQTQMQSDGFALPDEDYKKDLN